MVVKNETRLMEDSLPNIRESVNLDSGTVIDLCVDGLNR